MSRPCLVSVLRLLSTCIIHGVRVSIHQQLNSEDRPRMVPFGGQPELRRGPPHIFGLIATYGVLTEETKLLWASTGSSWFLVGQLKTMQLLCHSGLWDRGEAFSDFMMLKPEAGSIPVCLWRVCLCRSDSPDQDQQTWTRLSDTSATNFWSRSFTSLTRHL